MLPSSAVFTADSLPLRASLTIVEQSSFFYQWLWKLRFLHRHGFLHRINKVICVCKIVWKQLDPGRLLLRDYNSYFKLDLFNSKSYCKSGIKLRLKASTSKLSPKNYSNYFHWPLTPWRFSLKLGILLNNKLKFSRFGKLKALWL